MKNKKRNIKMKIKRFNIITKNIEQVKIQGARNIAKAALYAYTLIPAENKKTRKQAKKKLLSLRPTEPMLSNVLNKLDNNKLKVPYKKILQHFDFAQDKINKHALKIIKNNSVIFTHCHSTNVVHALIYAKKHGRKFQVFNTETRPLYQGRKTARELNKAKIKVTTFIDSAAAQAIKHSDMLMFGADAILKNGVINKIGSGMFSQIAKQQRKPLYIVADSWKFSPKNVKLEERHFKEIWKNAPKHVKIKNLAFEKIPKQNIKAIISEFGTLSYEKFLSKVNKSQKTG